MNKKRIYLLAGLGVVAVIGLGIGIYQLLKAPDDTKEIKKKEDKPQNPTSIKSKIGTRLRKESNTNSEILKTFQSIKDLRFVQSKQESDGLWYQVQEKNSDGDIIWTGWVRSDVVTVK
jgi:hypothetical protein